MSYLDRKDLLSADLMTRSISKEGSIKYYNSDKNVANIYMKLMAESPDGAQKEVSVDEASNYTVKIDVIKPKTNQIRTVPGVLSTDLTDETCAIWKFELGEDFTNQIGEVICQTYIKNSTQNLTMRYFAYTVEADKLTGLNAEIVTDPDLPILKELIKKVEELQANGGGTNHTHINKVVLDKITNDKIDTWDEKQSKTDNRLNTESKDIVGAINELESSTGNVDLSAYQTKSDDTLTTTNKTVIGSINELNNDKADKTEVLLSSKINDNGTGKDELWSADKVNAQFNTIAKKTIVENGKLFLLQEDGTKIDTGTTLPTGGSGGTSQSASIIYYNIKDFGAVGDGVTDDTSAIQTVLDKAITEKSVKVFIPNGTYKIKRLRLRKNTEIQMDQEAILLRNRDVATTETCPLFLNGEKGNNNYATGWNGDGNIKIQGGTINGNWKVGDQSGIAYGQTFAFGHAQNIQLLDIKFIDGANGDHVIDFSGCKDIYIDRCKFLGTHGVGRITEVIQLDYITTGSFPHFGSNDSTPTENVLIQNCYFSPNYDNADSICNISIGSHSAQHPHPSKNITFRKNIIVDSYAEAIKIVHSVNVDIYNNDIYYTKKNDCTNVILITTESSTNEYFEKSDYINIEKNIIHDLDSSSLHGVINIGSPSSDITKQSVAVNIRNNVFRNISTTKNISSYRDRIKCISYSSIFNSVVEGNVFENIPNCTCIDLSNCKNLNICKNYAYNVSNLISQFNLGTSSSCLTIDSNRAYNLSDCMFGFYDNYGNRINSYFTISNSITDSEKIINLNKCSNFNIVNNLCQNSIIEMQGCDGFKICNNILKTMSSEYVNEFNPLNNMIISYNTFTYIYDMRHYINSVFSNNIIKNNENSFNVIGANNFKICDNTIMYDLTGNNLTSAVYANRSDVTKLFYLNNNIFKSNNDYTFKYIVEVQSGTLAYCFNNDLPNTVGTGYYVNAKDGYITYNNKNKYLICVNSDGSISSIKINN